jgi:hypothetical protein
MDRVTMVKTPEVQNKIRLDEQHHQPLKNLNKAFNFRDNSGCPKGIDIPGA